MQNKPSIIVFSGYSGAGKDTAATAIGAFNVKFAAPGKRALEFMLRIPPGSLDDREFRQRIAPRCQGRTYLQVLMDFYHHRDLVIGADLFPEQTREVIQSTLHLGKDVAVTDMRKGNELSIIRDFAAAGYPIIPVWIHGGEELSTDKYQVDIYRRLAKLGGGGYEYDNRERKPHIQEMMRGLVARAKTKHSYKQVLTSALT